MIIRPATQGDFSAIDALLKAAFPSDAEVLLVERLRDQQAVDIELVALKGGQVIGHILFSWMDVGVDSRIVLTEALAPLSVLSAYRRQGVGAALVLAGLERARDRKYDAVVVQGDPDYYGRFGFRAETVAHLSSPYAGPYLMGLELVPAALAGEAGMMVHAQAFADL